MRRAARVDANQVTIVAGFRGLGASVAATHGAGVPGFPDLVIGYRGVTCLVEVKDPDKPPSARRLTEDQVKFHADWRGSISIVQTLDDVIELLAIMGGCECK